ncbi:thioredoxin family protein [Anaerobacillus sp. MEB173]|uniref:thioredoxin family protein n=1 Tax=Anaerobacillus sp. MEB173 TaxID=3383345 RepID=UPI003F916F54
MKKIIIFSLVIVVFFAALAVVTNNKNSQQVEGNPYGKEKLNPATVKQLDDPNYQNQILPEELRTSLDAGETVTVYFYSPTCQYCNQASPVIVPMAESLGIDMKLFNLLEFEEGWEDYPVRSTPTVIHFVDGEPVAGIEGFGGDLGEEEYKEWFSQLK